MLSLQQQSKGMTHMDIALTIKTAFAKSDVCLEFCCQPNNIALLTFHLLFVWTFTRKTIMQIAALTKLSTSQRSAQFPICGKAEIFLPFFDVTDHRRGGNTLIGSAVRGIWC